MKNSILKFPVAAIFSLLFTSANGQSSIDYNTFFKEYAQKRSEKHGINTPKAVYFGSQPMPIKPGNRWYYAEWEGNFEILKILPQTSVINNDTLYLVEVVLGYSNYRDTSYRYVCKSDSGYYKFMRSYSGQWWSFRYYKENVKVGDYWVDPHRNPGWPVWEHRALDSGYYQFYTIKASCTRILFKGLNGMNEDYELWSAKYGMLYAVRMDNGVYYLGACEIDDTLYGYTQVLEADDAKHVPASFSLSQNYPNPFNGSTVIKYELREPGFVTLQIFDVLGNKICTLAEGDRAAGEHHAIFEASNLSSGIYLCRLSTANKHIQRKMILNK